MTFSDKINLLFSASSFFLAVISIIFVVLTIRQNSKMIEASTRPYISVFIIKGVLTQIVIKNYGSTGAVITNVDCSADFSKCTIVEHTPFKNINGLHLVPNEFLTYEVNGELFFSSNRQQPITIEISYLSDAGHDYTDTIKLSLTAIESSLSSRIGINDSNWKEQFVNSLQNIHEVLLKK